MSTLAVQQAEATLAAARAEAQRQQRLDARDKISELAAEGALVKKELEPLKKTITTALPERLRLTGLLLQAKSQILFYATPLDPLTFPSDAETTEHGHQLELWQQRQRELLAANVVNEQRVDFSVRRHAARLAQRLEQIAQEIKNYKAIYEGRKPGQIEGGIGFVAEDFLGSFGLPPRHST